MKKVKVREDFPKEKYTRLMAENLPMLRMRMGITQDELAELTGSSRQMLSLMEREVRPMLWDTFMSMICVFRMNSATRDILAFLGIYTQELEEFINVSDSERFSR